MHDFALFSPVVPPARSGQAVILRRLLNGIEPARYYLLADRKAQEKNQTIVATEPLQAHIILMDSLTSQPVPLPGLRHVPALPYQMTREILGRARQFTVILRAHPVRALVVCTGDFYGFAAGCLAARHLRLPYLAYLFDDYLYQAPRYLRLAAWAIERFCLRGAAGVMVTNAFFQDLLRRRHGVDAVIIHNGIDLDQLQSTARSEGAILDQGHAIVYTGTIYNAHYDAFRHLIAAIDRLGRGDVKLHLFTFQTPEELARHGIVGPHVVVHGFRKQEQVLAAQREASLLFLCLAFDSPLGPLLRTAAPGKTAEYLAMGRPVLVHAPADTFISWYFKTHGCGFVASDPDPDAVARVLQEALFDAERRAEVISQARARAHADFDIAASRANFERVLQEVIVRARGVAT